MIDHWMMMMNVDILIDLLKKENLDHHWFSTKKKIFFILFKIYKSLLQ